MCRFSLAETPCTAAIGCLCTARGPTLLSTMDGTSKLKYHVPTRRLFFLWYDEIIITR